MEIFPRHWPYVRESTSHRWIPPTKASYVELWYFFDLLLNKGMTNRDAGDLRRHRAHYDVTVMVLDFTLWDIGNVRKVSWLFLSSSNTVTVNSLLQWRHNGRDGVSNHQPRDYLLNRLFRRRSKKTSKLRVTGLCRGNSPVTGEFSEQMTSNADNVSIWWRHHDIWNWEIGL